MNRHDSSVHFVRRASASARTVQKVRRQTDKKANNSPGIWLTDSKRASRTYTFAVANSDAMIEFARLVAAS